MSGIRNTALGLMMLAAAACSGGGGGGGGEPLAADQLVREELFSVPAVPVDFAFSDDGTIFIAELTTGNIRQVVDGVLLDEPLVTLPSSTAQGTGLLGLALDPDFSANGLLYAAYAAIGEQNVVIARLRKDGATASIEAVITDEIPFGAHSGGKLMTGPDDRLYVTTGDGDSPALAPQVDSLAGKILRFERDGSIPSDNPFPGSPVFALGFRNVFGIDARPGSSELFVSDNGPECDDEVNRLLAGGNYGWREGFVCSQSLPGEIAPLLRITPSIGITAIRFYRGDMFPELRGELLVSDFVSGSIRRLGIDDSGVTAEAFVLSGSGESILDIEMGPEGAIYYSTLSGISRLVRTAP